MFCGWEIKLLISEAIKNVHWGVLALCLGCWVHKPLHHLYMYLSDNLSAIKLHMPLIDIVVDIHYHGDSSLGFLFTGLLFARMNYITCT